MKILLNGKSIEANADCSLQTILHTNDYQGAYFAVAKNGEFISNHLYQQTFLSDGDVIEVIVPMQGG